MVPSHNKKRDSGRPEYEVIFISKAMTTQTRPPLQYIITAPLESDAEAIARAHALAWEQTYPNEEHGVTLEWVKKRMVNMTTPEGLKYRRNSIREANTDPARILYRVVKAKDSSEVYGFLYVTKDEEQAELQAIYLVDDAKGTGAAQDLMDEAVRFIGDLPCVLWTADYNQRAIRFYEKYGFQRISGTDKPHHEILTIFKMERPGGHKKEQV